MVGGNRHVMPNCKMGKARARGKGDTMKKRNHKLLSTIELVVDKHESGSCTCDVARNTPVRPDLATSAPEVIVKFLPLPPPPLFPQPYIIATLWRLPNTISFKLVEIYPNPSWIWN